MDFSDGNYPEGVNNENYDGCIKECREDETLVVDPVRVDWECVPNVINAALLSNSCPGKFNTGNKAT